MQGTYRSGRGIGCIQALGFLERACVDSLNGVQAWSRFVVSLDALEIEVNEFATCNPFGLECRANILNRRFQQMKSCRARRGRRRLSRCTAVTGQEKD